MTDIKHTPPGFAAPQRLPERVTRATEVLRKNVNDLAAKGLFDPTAPFPDSLRSLHSSQSQVQPSRATATSKEKKLGATGGATEAVETSTTQLLFVSSSYKGATSNGDFLTPYKTIQEAMEATATSSRCVLFLLPGDYFGANVALRANVFITSFDRYATRIGVQFHLNDVSWAQARGVTAGIHNVTLLRNCTFNFALQKVRSSTLFLVNLQVRGKLAFVGHREHAQVLLNNVRAANVIHVDDALVKGLQVWLEEKAVLRIRARTTPCRVLLFGGGTESDGALDALSGPNTQPVTVELHGWSPRALTLVGEQTVAFATQESVPSSNLVIRNGAELRYLTAFPHKTWQQAMESVLLRPSWSTIVDTRTPFHQVVSGQSALINAWFPIRVSIGTRTTIGFALQKTAADGTLSILPNSEMYMTYNVYTSLYLESPRWWFLRGVDPNPSAKDTYQVLARVTGSAYMYTSSIDVFILDMTPTW